jgi:glycosyltransferase involved in cell wall biosynthesis
MIGEVVHLVNRRGVRRAAKVIAMTHRIEVELKFLYSVHPVVIRPGVAEAENNDWVKPHCIKNQFRILSVSRLEPSKRLDEVIKTLSELRGCSEYSGVTWEVDFAGAGPALDDLQKLARSQELSDQIRFHGRVSDQQLEWLFSQSDIFIMPAVQGYGLPALEALIRNVPVILHQDSGVSEILSHTPWAQIVADCSELASALIQMRSRIEAGQLDSLSKPMIPLDVQWAGQIANECGW